MKKKIGKRIIQKALRDCYYDPNTPGPMKIIFDSGGPTYWENRAIELIKDAQNGTDYHSRITLAIQLLIHAKLNHE